MLNAHAYCSIHIIGASGSLILIDAENCLYISVTNKKSYYQP